MCNLQKPSGAHAGGCLPQFISTFLPGLVFNEHPLILLITFCY